MLSIIDYYSIVPREAAPRAGGNNIFFNYFLSVLMLVL